MIEWKCPNCKATLSGDEKRCYSYHRIVGENIAPVPSVTYTSYPDCTRLKALVGDAWKLLNDSYPVRWTGEHRDRYTELQTQLKREGIET